MPGPPPGTYWRNERCQRDLGLNYRQLCALVAAVTSYHLDGGPVCRLWVDRLVAANDDAPRYAGEELVYLSRIALVVEVARIENVAYYRPTERAIDKVLGWAGRTERSAAE